MDNFLGKGLDESMEKFREKCRQEKAELATVQDALGKEFPQKAELALTRENNSAVIRELQRIAGRRRLRLTVDAKDASGGRKK